jgi:xanthine dehydrogenase large subunit
MEAFAVREALRAAVGEFGPAGYSVDLGCPSTPEAVYWAIEAARSAGPVPSGNGGTSVTDAVLTGV